MNPMPRPRTLARPLVLLALAASAASAQETFTASHVAKTRMVTWAAISPDGTRVAYVLSVPRTPLKDEDGPAWEELHVVSSDGQSRPFVSGQENVSGVRWTPDGKALAFVAKRGADKARSLYVLPMAGGEARRLLAHDTDIGWYAFSPDGRQVAFVARPASPKKREELEKKGFNQEIYEEALVNSQVWIAALPDAAGGPPASGQPARALGLPGSASFVAWSPDGARLAVVLAPTSLVDDELMNRRVHIVDPASGQVVANLKNPGKLGPMAWSPDGRHIALVSAEDIHDPADGRLMVAPATGGPLKDLLPGYEGHVQAIAWTDNATLRYVGGEWSESVLAEVRADGTGGKVLRKAGGLVLNAIDQAPGGNLAILADAPGHPQELYFLAAGSAEPKRLTTSNPWLANMRLAKQEPVRFKARDGLELEGILVRPLDERAGQRYPLILTVHGGPESRDTNGWRTGYANPGQLAAAQGFAVFYPNYRGSTGRGVAFSKLSQGDPAGKEFDDLVDAVDHLVASGLVDRAKVGITGGSYGGYASAWGATYYTERFAAAVMFVGISDNVSRVGTTDIANEEYLVHARKRPWEDWQLFRDRSPISHAGKSRTATLILHGTADPRVHPTQSMALYRYLKLHAKTPVRLVWYPGEGHGNRRAASRLDYNLRLMQWMTHYLKGPGGPPPPIELDYAPEGATTATAQR
jgi:dipeptidyl aminopeptidase/acylaminoacyl peptidase